MAGQAKAERKRKSRGRGFAKASTEARGVLDTVAGKQGFAEPDVLLRWSEIAGAAYETLCRPVKIRYGANRSLGATLIVQTDSGRAPEVEHHGPRIIERINQFYGYRAITRLKVTQSTGLATAPTGFADEAAPFAGAPRRGEVEHQPGPSDFARAADLASAVTTPDLKAALTRMGAHVLARARSAPNRERGPRNSDTN